MVSRSGWRRNPILPAPSMTAARPPARQRIVDALASGLATPTYTTSRGTISDADLPNLAGIDRSCCVRGRKSRSAWPPPFTGDTAGGDGHGSRIRSHRNQCVFDWIQSIISGWIAVFCCDGNRANNAQPFELSKHVANMCRQTALLALPATGSKDRRRDPLRLIRNKTHISNSLSPSHLIWLVTGPAASWARTAGRGRGNSLLDCWPPIPQSVVERLSPSGLAQMRTDESGA
jgi:hypothetical protein